MELLDAKDVYSGFQYPNSFLRVVELNLVDFDLWYFMPKKQAVDRLYGLMKRYPDRRLVPFARRDDNDNIACFEVGKGSSVQIIHDFASVGYEQHGEYCDFWDWFKAAIEEMITVGGD